jgi:cysteinyl-tRNA synthetase
MSIKYLGEKFDIHTGGVDNIFPHHEGEIAQSEGFTGKPVVNSWVHGQHLLADGVKMAKSAGNSFIMSDIEAQGLDPMAFRYLCMTARYNTRLNFTFTSLRAAQRGLQRLKNRVWQWMIDAEEAGVTGGVDPNEASVEEWTQRFFDTVNSNLDMPGALALTWEMARSDLDSVTKLAVTELYDEVLGLGLLSVGNEYETPPEALEQLLRRAHLRDMAEYTAADQVRAALEEVGYVVEDHERGSRIRPKAEWEKLTEDRDVVSAAAEVPSLVEQKDAHDVSIGIVACNYVDDVKRVVSSALRCSEDRDVEVVVLDNGSTDETGEYLDELASSDSRVRVIHADHVLGEAAAKNIVLKQSLGRIVILLDTSVEVTGDIVGPIETLLQEGDIGVVGPFGLRTDNLHHFHDGEGESGDMDAMQAYCFAFRRENLAQVGLMRESFRFYRNLDIDYCFQYKDKGYRIFADSTLPMVRHEHRLWTELEENQRDELSRKNFGRFLKRWGNRPDLLITSAGRGVGDHFFRH